MVVSIERAKRDDDAAAQREIKMLLTFRAAGALNARDARRVDEALARDHELAEKYAVIQEAIHLNESLGAPSAAAIRRLLTAIDGSEREPAWLTFLRDEVEDAIHLYFLPITAAARQIAGAFLSGPYRPRQFR